jgi:hypothetical protein
MDPTTENKHFGKRFFQWKHYRYLLAIIGVLIIIRLVLPYIILHYANNKLSHMNGYYGRIRDIDLAIYRGAYKIKDMYLNKKDSVTGLETDFFDTQLIDLSIHWKALLNGELVGELEFEAPTIKFTKDKVDFKTVQQDTNDFRKLLRDFMPLRVNRFEIHGGSIRYRDLTSNPKLDIGLTDAFLKAENLTNVKEENNLLPSTVEGKANVYHGTVQVNMKVDPFNRKPNFDMNMELKNTNLPELNDFFKAYGKFDVNRGEFGLYMEGAAKNGNFVGYVKPIIKDLDVLGPEDKNDNILRQFWEGIVGTGGYIFRNLRHDQVATKIPLEGTISKTDADVLTAVIIVLKNAFIEALRPSIDNEISIDSAGKLEAPEDKKLIKPEGDNEDKKEEKKGFLKKVFGKKEKNKNEEEKK